MSRSSTRRVRSVPVVSKMRRALMYVVSLGAAVAPTPSGGGSTLPRGTVAVVDGIPAVGPPLHIPIEGDTSTFKAGTRVTVEGKTPIGRGGTVVLKMRRDGGRWVVLRRARASSNGFYRVGFGLLHRGRTQIRIVFPGGTFAYKWYRVV